VIWNAIIYKVLYLWLLLLGLLSGGPHYLTLLLQLFFIFLRGLVPILRFLLLCRLLRNPCNPLGLRFRIWNLFLKFGEVHLLLSLLPLLTKLRINLVVVLLQIWIYAHIQNVFVSRIKLAQVARVLGLLLWNLNLLRWLERARVELLLLQPRFVGVWRAKHLLEIIGVQRCILVYLSLGLLSLVLAHALVHEMVWVVLVEPTASRGQGRLLIPLCRCLSIKASGLLLRLSKDLRSLHQTLTKHIWIVWLRTEMLLRGRCKTCEVLVLLKQHHQLLELWKRIVRLLLSCILWITHHRIVSFYIINLKTWRTYNLNFANKPGVSIADIHHLARINLHLCRPYRCIATDYACHLPNSYQVIQMADLLIWSFSNCIDPFLL